MHIYKSKEHKFKYISIYTNIQAYNTNMYAHTSNLRLSVFVHLIRGLQEVGRSTAGTISYGRYERVGVRVRLAKNEKRERMK